MRALRLAAFALVGTAIAAPPALAHNGESETLSGMLEVAAGQRAALAVAGIVSSDTLEWNWSTTAVGLTAQLVWVDKAGLEHRLDPSSETYGYFRAPGELASARIEWTNAGPGDAMVHWNYLCVADFWSQPGLIVPAAIPLILLGVALAAGRLVDVRGRRKQDQGSEPR